MSKICPLCGGVAVMAGKNWFGEDVYECTLCHEPGHYSRFKEPTVFERITQSPEVLAKKLVYEVIMVDEFSGQYHCYKSTINGGEWYIKEEAYAATVARLKEVCND